MKAVIQRVSKASVSVKSEKVSEITTGLLILLGVVANDTTEDIDWLASKIANLRIFSDENGVMNLSIKEINGDAIVVSQFTLHAKTKKGNRPSYIQAANPEIAKPLYEKFISKFEEIIDKTVGTGKFGEMMEVELINSGPVTIIIDTKNKN